MKPFDIEFCSSTAVKPLWGSTHSAQVSHQPSCHSKLLPLYEKKSKFLI